MTLLLWVIFSMMVAVAAVGLAIPLVRRYDGQAREADAVTAVLRDQLTEVDAQAAAGTVPASEADALKVEIKRRLLVEHRALPMPAKLLGDRAAARVALGLVTVLALAATSIYALRGRPDLTAPAPPGVIAAEVADATGTASQSATAAGVSPVIAQLEARMAKAPNDPEGWKMLGWSYFQTQRFDDAAKAYAKAVALNPKGEGLASAYGEALVQAANGAVTPAAEAAFTQARALDPKDARARYFLAVLRDEKGDHKGAIDEWVTLLNEAPPGAAWAPQLRQFVEQSAAAAKIDLTGRLKDAAPIPTGAAPIIAGASNARGPSAADVANVQAMPQGAQAAFIKGMVDSLAAKLKANPRDADGWVRLIRARKVMGDMAAAKAALAEGQAAFVDEPATQKSLADQAAALGVA